MVKPKAITEETKVESTGYIDDVTHVVGAKNKEELEIELNNLYSLLKPLYNNKILQMNGTKTCFITIASSHDNRSPNKLKIKVDENFSITEDQCIKILGFFQNRQNSMDTQVNAIAAKTGMLMSKLKPVNPYLDYQTRRTLITMKVKAAK